MKAVLYSDGGSRGNPGPAGIGFTLQTQSKEKIFELGSPIGIATNNVAEYKALLQGISKAIELGYDELDVFIDSQLIEKQIKGEYKVKSQDLLPYYKSLIEIIKSLKCFQISHVKREFNKRADALVNEALDLDKEVSYFGKNTNTINEEVDNGKFTKLIQTYLSLSGIEVIDIYELENNIVIKMDRESSKIVIEKLTLIRDMIKDADKNVLLDVR